MKAPILKALKTFVGPYYAAQDSMRDYGHVSRILETARALTPDDPHIDEDLLVFGAHFHGVIGGDKGAVRRFLATQGLTGERIDHVVQVAHESLKEGEPLSREGAVLHDAHLTEGGPAFTVIKALVTGRERGQTDLDSAAFLRDRVLGHYRCATRTGQAWYAQNERYAHFFLNRLAPRIARQEGQTDFPEGPDPYAGDPTVSLICPWCNEEVALPASLAGNDVLCPECLEAVFLAPALMSAGPARAEKTDLDTFPALPRCPRCRSRAVWRMPVWLLGVGLLLLASGMAIIAPWHIPEPLSPYVGPFFLLAGAVGLALLFCRADHRCSQCGHRWQ